MSRLTIAKPLRLDGLRSHAGDGAAGKTWAGTGRTGVRSIPRTTEPTWTAFSAIQEISACACATASTPRVPRFATPDGRWAIVSTGMTVLVAGAITLMAMGTMPAANPVVGAPSHIPLSYELLRLISPPAPEAPAATPAETINPGFETRTVTLDSGDTLAGILEDVGISASDANAAIAALRDAYDPRALRAGQSFDITYSVASTIDATGTVVRTAPPKPRTTVITVNHRQVTVPLDADADSTRKIPRRSRGCCRCIFSLCRAGHQRHPRHRVVASLPRTRKRSCRPIATAPAPRLIPVFTWQPCRPASPPMSWAT